MSVYTDNMVCGPWFDSDYLDDCCKATRTADPPVDAAIVTEMILAASDMMYYRLARQFRGICEATFRPAVSCGCGYYGWGSGRAYAPDGCCVCGGHVPQIDLGFFPVTEIKSIRMNGVNQTIGNFHVDEYRYLVANDGATFPVINNLFSVAGDANDIGPDQWVFEVSINYGQDPPVMAKRAAAKLACELIKGCMDLPCVLPARTVSYVRQGVSAQVMSAQDILNQDLIGIMEIDLAVRMYNPAHLQSPSYVWSPDLRQGGRRTHT